MFNLTYLSRRIVSYLIKVYRNPPLTGQHCYDITAGPIKNPTKEPSPAHLQPHHHLSPTIAYQYTKTTKKKKKINAQTKNALPPTNPPNPHRRNNPGPSPSPPPSLATPIPECTATPRNRPKRHPPLAAHKSRHDLFRARDLAPASPGEDECGGYGAEDVREHPRETAAVGEEG